MITLSFNGGTNAETNIGEPNPTSSHERLGDKAIRLGFTTQTAVDKALSLQRSRLKAGQQHTPLGLLLVENGALTQVQLIQLLDDHASSGFKLSEDAIRLASRLWNDPETPTEQIMFTAAGDTAGVTTVVSQLGFALALMGQGPLLLIDTNQQGSGLHNRFHARKTPGLSEVFAGRATLDEALFKTGIDGLSILPIGEADDNFMTQLLSAKSRKLFNSLSQRFKRVLLNCPPFLTFPEATLFTQQVDAIILIAGSGHTRKMDLTQIQSSLGRCRSKLQGVVLSSVLA